MYLNWKETIWGCNNYIVLTGALGGSFSTQQYPSLTVLSSTYCNFAYSTTTTNTSDDTLVLSDTGSYYMELSVQISKESSTTGSVAFGTLNASTLYDFSTGMDALIYPYVPPSESFDEWGNSISKIVTISSNTNYLQIIKPDASQTTTLLSWTLYVSKLG